MAQIAVVKSIFKETHRPGERYYASPERVADLVEKGFVELIDEPDPQPVRSVMDAVDEAIENANGKHAKEGGVSLAEIKNPQHAAGIVFQP